MNAVIKNNWENIYATNGFIFGTDPSEYLVSNLDKTEPGKILFAGEGEGRNAVYAAAKGWNVSAFDISENAKNKALTLAEKTNTQLDYTVAAVEDLPYHKDEFDVLAMIFCHFPSPVRTQYHRALANYIKPGGILIIEGFCKKHNAASLHYADAIHPIQEQLLYDMPSIKSDFDDFAFLEMNESLKLLNHGAVLNGRAIVIQAVGVKKQN